MIIHRIDPSYAAVDVDPTCHLALSSNCLSRSFHGYYFTPLWRVAIKLIVTRARSCPLRPTHTPLILMVRLFRSSQRPVIVVRPYTSKQLHSL